MMSILTENFSCKELHSSWKAYHSHIKRKTSVGVDGVTKANFVANLDTNLKTLSREVLRGEFTFSPLRPLLIPKESGGFRVINIPTIRDRFVQRIIFQILISKYKDRWKTPFSFSSMGGSEESTGEILDRLSARCFREKWIIKTDISKYFDAIDRQEMKRILHKEIRCSSLHGLLDGIVDCEHQPVNAAERKEIEKAGIRKGRGLRQGMTLSPIFAYLFLRREDSIMPIDSYFRYVDDIVIIGSSQDEVKERFQALKISFKIRGLSLHELDISSGNPKTVLIKPTQSFEFLGIGLKRSSDVISYYVPKGSISRIIKKIEKKIDYEELRPKQQRSWVAETSRYAANLVEYYRPTYEKCDNWNSLQRILEERQSYLINGIVETLIKLNSTTESRHTLLRLFGVGK